MTYKAPSSDQSDLSRLEYSPEVVVPVRLLEQLVPVEPINDDERGGCVWCGGHPEGEPYGYATASPADHEGDCPWVQMRALLAAAVED